MATWLCLCCRRPVCLQSLMAVTTRAAESRSRVTVAQLQPEISEMTVHSNMLHHSLLATATTVWHV
eukprot:m.27357 g.27357  ORF g.27357 m.27357 type:complete len:66 (-) comp10076_c0_seq1:312-509(-)